MKSAFHVEYVRPLGRILSVVCLITLSGLLHAQGLPATLLLTNQTLVEGELLRRQPGTTVVQFLPRGETSRRSLNLEEIETIFFDISAFRPQDLKLAFQAERYSDVIDGLKGRIVPYFSYTDQNANSNELVMMFIRSLYRTGNTAGVDAARNEVEKYAATGEVRRLAELVMGLDRLDAEDAEGFDKQADWFRAEGPEDPLAPMIHIGNAHRALLDEDWDTAYPLYARVITLHPLSTPWVFDALYHTAVYHQNTTNLVVAHQISQELGIITTSEEWKTKAASLQDDLETAAAAAGVDLPEFGTIRGTPRGSGAAEIDYQQRQRELEESTVTP